MCRGRHETVAAHASAASTCKEGSIRQRPTTSAPPLQLRVVAVAVVVTRSLLGEVGLHGGREVDPRLVGQADQHPQHVGHLVGKVALLALLEGLVTVGAGHDAGQFAHLLRQNGHIGQLTEIAHAVLVNPPVDALLQLLQFHCSSDFKRPKDTKKAPTGQPPLPVFHPEALHPRGTFSPPAPHEKPRAAARRKP